MPTTRRSTRVRQRRQDTSEDERPVRNETSAKVAKESLSKAKSSNSNSNGGTVGSPDTFTIPLDDKKGKAISCQTHPANTQHSPVLIFTHGAGGTISAPAVLSFATGFAEHDTITCFQGTMNLPHRQKCFDALLAHYPSAKAVGGRSMGARAAVLSASAHEHIKTVIAVSFPLVSDKGDSREDILLALPADVDVLFITGDRDRMCDLQRLEGVRRRMTARSWGIVVKGADHGMTMGGGKGGVAIAREVVRQSGGMAAKWLVKRQAEATECDVSWDVDGERVRVGEWRAASEEDKTAAAAKAGRKRVVAVNEDEDGEAGRGEGTSGRGSSRKKRQKGGG